MLIAYRCRLYPNAEQQAFFAKSFGCVRWVYNEALAYCKAQREAGAKHPSAIDLQKRLPALKKQHEWLAEVDSQALKQACRDLDSGFQHFFRRVKAGQTPGYPRFKSKRDHRRSFTAMQNLHVSHENRQVKIPKLGWVKCRGLREFEGKIKRITVSQQPSGKYYASVLVENGAPEPAPAPVPDLELITGIDMGCKTEGDQHQFAVLSHGQDQVIYQPAHLKTQLKKLARAQRKLARKTKGSANWHKQRQRVAILHERIGNRRRDFLHQTTHRLTSENQCGGLAVEDLNVRGMMAAPKPKQDGTGHYLPNGRSSKRGLARSLSNVALGEFMRQLEYKCLWRGVSLIQCDRWDPSSKTCSACGSINTELTLSDRAWTCRCGAKHHRDINAAINIARFAHARAVGPDRPELTPPDSASAA